MSATILINRAPVLVLWGAVVAERLGFQWDEALTLGRVLAGLNAYSKGLSLGLFEPVPEAVREQRRAEKGTKTHVDLMRRAIPVMVTPDGLRATSKGRPTSPESVEHYLKSKFGDALDSVTNAMRTLARSMPPIELSAEAYGLYERFRPEIPTGVGGWGATGELRIADINALANRSSVRPRSSLRSSRSARG